MASTPTPLPRVLVIDDDEVMRELLEALLGAEGYAVQTAESGEAALGRLRERPDAEVVLADVQLPGIRGVALANALRAVVPEARLIGMSGSEPGLEIREGCDGFLRKPFSADEFGLVLTHGAGVEPVEADVAAVAEIPGAVPLDDAIFDRLAGSLPAAQLRELYHMTLHDASGRLALMADALAVDDFVKYRQEAHALKGGCSMVGAVELASLAARAEQTEAGSSGGTPAMQEFREAAERLRSILTARFVHNV